MSEMTLFKGSKALVNQERLKELQEINKKLTGGGFSGKRISFRGSRFRRIVDGEEVGRVKGNELNVVILDAAPIQRQYYEGPYDSEKSAPPRCWSLDTKVPSDDVPEDDRMSDTCAECPMNVKGSGQGESRACRFSQRMAIAVEGNYEEVYQIQLASTSIFGDAVGQHMPMQAYARFLNGHNAPVTAIVTEMSFDEDSDVPKLFFRPVRPLEEDELTEVLELRKSEDVKKAITFTVFQTDHAESTPEAEEEEAPASKSKAKKAEPAEEEEEAPPKRRGRGRAKKEEPEEEAPAPKARKVAAFDDDSNDDSGADDGEEEAPPPKAKKASAFDDADDEEEPPEPKRAKSKKTDTGEPMDLTSLIDQWDD